MFFFVFKKMIGTFWRKDRDVLTGALLLLLPLLRRAVAFIKQLQWKSPKWNRKRSIKLPGTPKQG